MNVKVITTALQHLVGGAALNVALGARLELATQKAIAARGREAIIVYQWYSRCVKDPSLEDFESWLSKKNQQDQGIQPTRSGLAQFLQVPRGVMRSLHDEYSLPPTSAP